MLTVCVPRHTFPLPDLAVHVIGCKVDFELSAVEVMLIPIYHCALCRLRVKELYEGEPLLLSCVPVCHNPVEQVNQSS